MRVLVLAIALASSTAMAADKPCSKQIYTNEAEPNYSCPSPGEEAMVPRLQLKTSVVLKPKSKVPWEGLLLDKNRIFSLGLRIKALRRLRWLDLKGFAERREAERKFEAAQFNATINLRTSQRENYKRQTKSLQEEVIRLNKWYRSPTFWFATGFVVAVAGATALAFGLRK